MNRFLLLSLLLIPSLIRAEPSIAEANSSTLAKMVVNVAPPVYEYTRSPHVSPEVWEMVKPYLLPSNHPAKPALDKIFKRARVTASPSSVKKAGFETPFPRDYSHCIVSHHKHLKGYLVKMFTDDQTKYSDYKACLQRIKGAKSIQKAIDKHDYNHLFKVPKKWIYPLPENPPAANPRQGKHFILVVEDMNIYHRQRNYDRWRGSRMTRERADAIYVLLDELGLSDSIRAFNIPFCKDGKQSFIDTEHHHQWPVHFDILARYFSSKMEQYWIELIRKNGPH